MLTENEGRLRFMNSASKEIEALRIINRGDLKPSFYREILVLQLSDANAGKEISFADQNGKISKLFLSHEQLQQVKKELHGHYRSRFLDLGVSAIKDQTEIILWQNLKPTNTTCPSTPEAFINTLDEIDFIGNHPPLSKKVINYINTLAPNKQAPNP